jgi:hypothetical protein
MTAALSGDCARELDDQVLALYANRVTLGAVWAPAQALKSVP